MLKMQDKYKNILIIILFLLLICSGVAIFYLVNEPKDKLIEITGKVIVSDSSYVIVETKDDDYLVSNIKGNYNIGDEVKFTYLNSTLTNQDALKTVKATDEDIIKIGKIEEKESTKENSNNDVNNTVTEIKEEQNNLTKSSNINENIKIIDTKENNSVIIKDSSVDKEILKKDPDTEVLSYFQSLKNDIDTKGIKEKVKTGFIDIVDFLFYKGTIKGYSLKDITESTKLKLFDIALYFDKKIDTYFPNYKENISNTTGKVYTNAKSEIVESYMEVINAICKNDAKLCETAKQDFAKVKNTFGLTWALIKDIAGDGVSYLKNWYEIWSGK